VALIFSRVYRDALASGLDTCEGSLEYVWVIASAGIAKGGDLIDVDAEIDHVFIPPLLLSLIV
jgi:hypothetical protein